MAEKIIRHHAASGNCYCCGHSRPDTNVTSGAMHFRCWDEHHSDPTGEWPRGHECEGDKR